MDAEMKSLRTRVLVVGGGPAGSVAARFLAREGVDTLLIERDFSFVKPCGGGIPSSAFDELDLPLSSRIRDVDTIKIVSPGGDSIPIKLKGATISIVGRGHFDSLLRREAEKAGARVLEASFRSVADNGKKAVVSVITAGGEEALVESDYLIAADGVNSRVRAELKMGLPHSLMTITEKMAGAETDCCEFWFGASHAPQLYSWVFPWGEGVSAGTGSFMPGDLKGLLERFLERRKLKKALSYAPDQGQSVRGYRIPLWKGDIYTCGRILFAGDAAGQVLPLTFEGIYYAMRSAEMAATAIIEGDIRSYKKRWERSFGKRFALMRRLWEYFLRDDERAEKLVQFHKRPEVQDSSMRLWLRKDPGKGSLLSYIKLFRRLFIG